MPHFGEALFKSMLKVVLREGENVDSLIRRFNTIVRNDGVLDDYKERMSYTKPSQIRKNKKNMRKINDSRRNN